jgi:hypothetical protein
LYFSARRQKQKALKAGIILTPPTYLFYFGLKLLTVFFLDSKMLSFFSLSLSRSSRKSIDRQKKKIKERIAKVMRDSQKD